jgi:hypothetical protein
MGQLGRQSEPYESVRHGRDWPERGRARPGRSDNSAIHAPRREEEPGMESSKAFLIVTETSPWRTHPALRCGRHNDVYSPVCNNVPARRALTISRAKPKAAPAKRSESIASPVNIRSVRRT